MIAFFQRLFETRFWYFLAGLCLFRFAFIVYSGLDLVGDEAYYWDWSRHPDWCYYSKPPMVAWLIGGVAWAFGDTTAAVRLMAVALGGGFLWIFYLTAKLFYSARAGAIALLLLLATPANAISNLIMTIDPPMSFFWIVTIYYLHAALFKQDQKAWWLAGVFSALAFLSKPTALALPGLLGMYLLVHGKYRNRLRRELLIFLIPTLISLAMIMAWNMQHDWIMIQHNQDHFVRENGFDPLQRLSEFFVFLGLQLLLFSPLVFVLLMRVSWDSLRHYFTLSDQDSFLLWMGPVPLLGVFVLGILQKVQGNWPLPFYFATFLLLSGRLAQLEWSAWLKPALFSGYAMVLLAYMIPFIIPALGLSNTRADPTYRLRQWRSLAAAVDQIRQREFATIDNTFIWVDAHRDLVSELAFYLPDHPRVFRLAPPGKIESQYELWPGPVDYVGKDALILSSDNPQQVTERLRHAFVDWSYIDTVTALEGSRKERRYYVYIGKQLRKDGLLNAFATPVLRMQKLM